MCADFKEKRINYLNNWPQEEPFEIEKKYYEIVKNIKDENGTIYIPFQLKKNEDVLYNKTISFMIESLDNLEKYPNFSYEFIFKAYDCFIEHYHLTFKGITDKNKMLCDNEWCDIIGNNTKLMQAFEQLLSVIPVKVCQYVYVRFFEKTNPINKSYSRVTTDTKGSSTATSNNRKLFVDAIENKYGLDYYNYANTIRKASLLYRYLLNNNSIIIDSDRFNITLNDKLHILVSGFLYTLRNDIMHGSSISITKSSKTNLGTFALNYYAFLLLYYLLLILIINKFSSDYSSTVYDDVAENINKNIFLYKELFGKELGH